MYSYSGNNPHVAEVIAAVNSANAAGKVYPVQLRLDSSMSLDLLDPKYQLRAIEAHSNRNRSSQKVYMEQWKSPSASRSFKEGVASGEILISEYASGSLQYVMTARHHKPKTVELVAELGDNAAFMVNDKLFFPIAVWGPGYPVVKPQPQFQLWTGGSNNIFHDWVHRWLWDGDPVRWGVIEPSPARITLTLPLDETSEPMPIVSLRGDPDWSGSFSAITDCSNRLIEAQADVLTAIAEMRETVIGIQSNVLRTAEWINDIIKHNASRRASSNLQSLDQLISTGSRRAFIRRLKRDISRAQRREQSKRDRLQKKYGNASAKEAVDRVTSHWLDAQYGIQPAVLTINDLLETLRRQKRVFHRARVAWSPQFPPVTYDGWKVTDASTAQGWVWGKVRYELSSFFSSLASYTRLNIPLTAWERVPLSFVVDWLFPIGDILSSLRIGEPKPAQFVMTKSFLRKVDVTLTKETDAVTYTVRVTGYVYGRLLTNPSEGILQIGLTPNLNLSWKRWVTAFALSWARVRGTKIHERILK